MAKITADHPITVESRVVPVGTVGEIVDPPASLSWMLGETQVLAKFPGVPVCVVPRKQITIHE